MTRPAMKRPPFLTTALAAVLCVALAHPAAAGTAGYRQGVWFTWSKGVVDVLIVPPGHGQVINGNGILNGGDAAELDPYRNSYLAAIERSVKDWRRGVAAFGADWLRSRMALNVFVLGRDAVPTSVLLNPEVVIVTDETKGPLLGAALNTRPCIVDNSKFFVTSFTYEDMYNINGHEFGHCLGLDHSTGPANDQVIAHDLMNGRYPDTPGAAGGHRHCVSNLNVRGLERVFGGLVGKPTGGSVTLSASQYQRIAC